VNKTFIIIIRLHHTRHLRSQKYFPAGANGGGLEAWAPVKSRGEAPVVGLGGRPQKVTTLL